MAVQSDAVSVLLSSQSVWIIWQCDSRHRILLISVGSEIYCMPDVVQNTDKWQALVEDDEACKNRASFQIFGTTVRRCQWPSFPYSCFGQGRHRDTLTSLPESVDASCLLFVFLQVSCSVTFIFASGVGTHTERHANRGNISIPV